MIEVKVVGATLTNCLTQRALDAGDSAAFLGSFLLRAFPASQLSRALPTTANASR